MSRSDYPIWHPFTPYAEVENLISIARAEGVYLYDLRGNAYLDAISSWWVNIHGHCNEYINEALRQQLSQLEHCLFSGFTHDPAVALADRLLSRLPEEHTKIFFSDDGSTAVEVALKMAIQYWDNKGIPKSNVLAFEGAYHGDTFGGMSVGERNVFNNAFKRHLFTVTHVPLPTPENKDFVMQLIREVVSGGDVAAFIFEPLVQGAAGMRMYDAAVLDQIIELCQEYSVLTIADEVMTGFGRTGAFFACDHIDNAPDIIALSKGLTGGYMPLGVTSCHKKVYEAYCTSDRKKTFFHGHSYTGNPLACAAAVASFDLLVLPRVQDRIHSISTFFKKMREEFSGEEVFIDVRSLGAIIAFELRTKEQTSYLNSVSRLISSYFIQRGIIIRPLGNIFYLIPPYVISDDELVYIRSVIRDFVIDYR